MDYVSIFNAPPVEAVLLSVLQTATIYFLVLLGLKLAGRRIFAEQSPQDLVILVLIAEACDLGLSDERAGYWGTIASVVTILFLGWFCERIPVIRDFFQSAPVALFKDGHLYRARLRKFMVDEEDLEVMARQHGHASYKDFKSIYVEGDGKLTGVL